MGTHPGDEGHPADPTGVFTSATTQDFEANHTTQLVEGRLREFVNSHSHVTVIVVTCRSVNIWVANGGVARNRTRARLADVWKVVKDLHILEPGGQPTGSFTCSRPLRDRQGSTRQIGFTT